MSKTRLDPLGVALVLFGAVCISFSPVLVKLAGVQASMASIYRQGIGGTTLLILALATRQRFRVRPGVYGFALACALVYTVDLECWHRSVVLVGPGLSTIVVNFQVFFVAAFGALFFRERLRPLFALALFAAMAGIWLLAGVDAPSGRQQALPGVALALTAAVAYAGYILLVRHGGGKTGRAEQLPALPFMAMVTLATFGIVCLELALGPGFDFSRPNRWTLPAMIAYGLGPQALGWLSLLKGLPRVPAGLGGLLLLLQPTLSFCWDILFFSRETGPWGWAGAALTLCAMYLGMRSARPDA